LAFMRPEAQIPDLEYMIIVKEPLVVALPNDHRLVSKDTANLCPEFSLSHRSR